MSRTRDLWFTTGRRSEDGERAKTARHPDMGGDRDAKRYLAIWIDPEGRERTKAFAKKGDADRFGTRMESDKLRGEYIDPHAGRTTVDALARKWLSLREVGTGTAARYRSCYTLHIEPVLGKRHAGKVSVSDVAAWSKSLASQPGNRTLALVILTGIFDLAVADKVRRDNPVRNEIVGRVKRQPVTRDSWTAGQIQRSADALSAEYHDVPLAAAGLGLRQGEVFGLSLDDMDPAAGLVHVRRQYARRGTWKLPKGGKVRNVPLPPGVLALAQAVEPVEVTLPWENEDGTLGDPVTIRLLWSRNARPLESWWWHRYQWKGVIAALGLPVAHENGMHALRHWYSTTLLDNGVSLAAVMEFMGHSRESAPLAVGVYGHVTPEAYEAARITVDSSLFGLRPIRSDGTVTELRRAQ